MMKLDKHHVKILINRWRKILELESNWKIEFEIRNSASEMSDGNQDSMACIHVDLRYFVADIEFNATEIDENELDAVILHELLHIIVEPLALSSACGMGKKYEEMNSVLCESTIERLLPGYLNLYQQKYGHKKHVGKKNLKKTSLSTRAIKCHKKR